MAERGELLGGDGQLPLTEAGAEGAQAAAARKESGQGFVGALDEVDRAGVADLAEAAFGVVQQSGCTVPGCGSGCEDAWAR
ncbi:hypothetical protein OG266_19755 [Streptomyces sp. NBC_00554]|uniref:hypothetical protein n=1 Tax=Streptomyces sp. NBC_00554 TaxID=2903661 RepID=UPI00352E3192|nr:hypothetical protein OG266_19755 [Streptomyces sp. NBC_00554]